MTTRFIVKEKDEQGKERILFREESRKAARKRMHNYVSALKKAQAETGYPEHIPHVFISKIEYEVYTIYPVEES